MKLPVINGRWINKWRSIHKSQSLALLLFNNGVAIHLPKLPSITLVRSLIVGIAKTLSCSFDTKYLFSLFYLLEVCFDE